MTSGLILRLDADYMLEPALRDEIAVLAPDQATAAYRIAFTYCMEGMPLRACSILRNQCCSVRGCEAFAQDGWHREAAGSIEL